MPSWRSGKPLRGCVGQVRPSARPIVWTMPGGPLTTVRIVNHVDPGDLPALPDVVQGQRRTGRQTWTLPQLQGSVHRSCCRRSCCSRTSQSRQTTCGCSARLACRCCSFQAAATTATANAAGRQSSRRARLWPRQPWSDARRAAAGTIPWSASWPTSSRTARPQAARPWSLCAGSTRTKSTRTGTAGQGATRSDAAWCKTAWAGISGARVWRAATGTILWLWSAVGLQRTTVVWPSTTGPRRPGLSGHHEPGCRHVGRR